MKFATPKIYLLVQGLIQIDTLRNKRVRKPFYFPLGCLKYLNKGLIPKIGDITNNICKEYGLGVMGEILWATQCLNVSSFCVANKHLFIKHLLLHLHKNCLTSL